MFSLTEYLKLDIQRRESYTGKITKKEFDEWHKKSIFDKLTGKSTGLSFCDYFNVTDFKLLMDQYHPNFDSVAYIQKHYVDR